MMDTSTACCSARVFRCSTWRYRLDKQVSIRAFWSGLVTCLSPSIMSDQVHVRLTPLLRSVGIPPAATGLRTSSIHWPGACFPASTLKPGYSCPHGPGIGRLFSEPGKCGKTGPQAEPGCLCIHDQGYRAGFQPFQAAHCWQDCRHFSP